MRRTDKECNDPAFIDDVLSRADTIFLALHAGEYPYCLPVNFVKQDNRIYIHCALEGRKLDCIRNNPHIAFSAAIDLEIDTAKSTTYYKSVCGTALASIVQNQEEKGLALDALAIRYNALCKRPAPLANINRTAIIRLDIQSVTGKRNIRKE